VIDQKDYNRMHELLLYLDFANLEVSRESTQRWINEVRGGTAGNTSEWGTKIIGTRAIEAKNDGEKKTVTTLNTGLIRKKRKGEEVTKDDQGKTVGQSSAPPVNVLGAGMVRKKPKTA